MGPSEVEGESDYNIIMRFMWGWVGDVVGLASAYESVYTT